MNSVSFSMSERVLFYLCFGQMFWLGIEIWVFFQCFQRCSIDFCLYCCQWEICYHSYLCFSVQNMSFFLWIVLRFLYHWFWIISLCSFFHVSYAWACWDCWICWFLVFLLIKFEKISVIISSSIFFSTPSHQLSFQDSDYMYTRLLEFVS